MVVNMEIRMIPPPVGYNLFVTSRRGEYADDECGPKPALPSPQVAVRLCWMVTYIPVHFELGCRHCDGGPKLSPARGMKGQHIEVKRRPVSQWMRRLLFIVLA